MANEKYHYGLPFGDGQQGPRIVMVEPMFGQQQRPRQPEEVNEKIWENEEFVNRYRAQTAAIVADVRHTQGELFLKALAEMRSALAAGKLSDGDKGSTERPPIENAFDEINTGRLQEAYLNMTMRYFKYIDTICKDDFGFEPPNGINDKKEEPKKKKS